MASGDPIPWTALPYSSPWHDYGGGWCPGQYMKDSAGWVYVRGLIQQSASYGYGGTNSTICYMPVGYRPQATWEMFHLVGNDSVGNWFLSRIDVSGSNGQMYLQSGVGTNNGAAGWQNLSSMRYFAGF